MKIILIFLVIALYALTSKADVETRKRIAVMDTGVSLYQIKQDYMCKDAPFKYVFKPFHSAGLDYHGHGTNVISLIAENMDRKKYCITMYSISSEWDMREQIILLDQMIKDKVVGLNASLAGLMNHPEERLAYGRLAKAGITAFIAAGNSGRNLNTNCNVYPACYKKRYKNIIVVGSFTGEYSNSGNIVDLYIDGTNKGSPVMSGTSQATAIATGLYFSK